VFISEVLQGCVSFGHLLKMGPNNRRSLEWMFKLYINIYIYIAMVLKTSKELILMNNHSSENLMKPGQIAFSKIAASFTYWLPCYLGSFDTNYIIFRNFEKYFLMIFFGEGEY
jgi:hypothetical protein